MPLSYAQYAGNGSATSFSVPFPYLLKAHVKLFYGYDLVSGSSDSELVEGVGFTWTSGTQVKTTVAPAVGQLLTVIRQTPTDALAVQWQDGSNLIAGDLQDASLQTLYAVQEQEDMVALSYTQSVTAATTANAASATANAASATANSISGTANTALSNSNTALTAANAASATATAAQATASGIAGTANTALTTANAASATATAAQATANGIAGTANTALSSSSEAMATADAAATTATGIAGTADAALTTANAALTTANAASATATAAQDAAGAAMPKAGGTFTGNIAVPSINNGPLAGFRNAIINGNFDIWQRGTADFGQGYWADRWNAYLVAGVSMLQSRYTLTDAQRNIIGYEAAYAWQVFTSDTTSSVQVQQPIEGVKTFAGQQVAVSFWAFTDAGTCTISSQMAQFFGTGGSPSATVETSLTLSATTITTTPTKITAVVTLPSITSKTLGTNAGTDSVSLVIRKVAGAANRLRIAQVQVEPGPVATPFERRPIGTEFALCQRYFQKTFSVMSFVGSVSALSVRFAVNMRNSPTVSVATSLGSTVSSTGGNYQNQDGFRVESAGGSDFTWTASAEL